MPAENFSIVYDVSREWIGVAPVALTSVWLVALIGIPIAMCRGKRRWPPGIALWWLLWAALGAIGYGNVWYQHFHCIAVLKSGHAQQISGVITSFRPEEAFKKGSSEEFSVGGMTFRYFSANLGAGGLRSTGGASGPMRIGQYVRVTYEDGTILRLEIRQP